MISGWNWARKARSKSHLVEVVDESLQIGELDVLEDDDRVLVLVVLVRQYILRSNDRIHSILFHAAKRQC